MLKTMRNLGAFSFAAESGNRRNSLLILCYHGIALRDEHQCWPSLFITAEQFRERLKALRRFGASVLPLGEALERLKRNSLPPRSVAITFDDGFYDFLSLGVPILSEFRYPCTLYLTTHYCDYRLPIIGLMLHYLLWRSGRPSVRLPQVGIAEMPIANYHERQEVVTRLLKLADQQRRSTLAKDEMARALAEQFSIDYNEIVESRILQILNPAEVADVANAGVDIQLHTHRHRTPRDQALFMREIEDNRRRILEFTGKAPVHFCYPSGDYAPEFFSWLAECGVESATTCDSGLAGRRSAWMKLPRVLDDCGMNALRFESVLSGVFV